MRSEKEIMDSYESDRQPVIICNIITSCGDNSESKLTHQDPKHRVLFSLGD